MQRTMFFYILKYNQDKSFLIALLLCLLIFCNNAFAVNYQVKNANNSGPDSLRQALLDLNSGGTTGAAITNNKITIDPGLGTITLLSDLPVINQRGVTICVGNTATNTCIPGSTRQTISGGNTPGLSDGFRLFATYKASLQLQDLILTNGGAIGGNGGAGAGGGMGAGGGVYIDPSQALSLLNTSIINSTAAGGIGGGAGGGGGQGAGASWTGFAGASKNPGGGPGGDFPGVVGTTSGGAGGGQAYTNNGEVSATGYGGGAGGFKAAGGGAGGGSGAAGAGAGAATSTGGAGGYCGGGGGGGDANRAGNGGGGNPGGAGGLGIPNFNSGNGGGGYGSGGAAGVTGGGGGGFGGSGASSYVGGGGGGGFGGGGGGGQSSVSNGPGAGGSYAGSGTQNQFNSGPGGGGAGIGGAIFVADKATLTIGDYTNNSLLPTGTNVPGNQAVGGASSGNAGRPNASDQSQGLFSDIFLFQAASLTFTPSNNLTVPFSIQGDTAGTNRDNGVTINSGGAGSGTAVVTFTAVTSGSSIGNTYFGGTTITAGTLMAAANNVPIGRPITVGTNGIFYMPTSATTFTGAFTNNGKINIGGPFTPSAYTSTNGRVYVIAGGSIGTAITQGNSINIGLDSNAVSSPVALTTAVAFSLPVSVYTGSSLVTTTGGSSSGNLYMLGASTFSGSNISGSILTIGQDFFGTTDSSTAFTASQNITTFPVISVVAGNFSSNNRSVTASTSFTVASNASSTIVGGTLTTPTFTNNSSATTTISTGGAITTSSSFVNAGNLVIDNTTFTVPGSFTNTSGNIYVTRAAAISGNIAAGVSFNVGQNPTLTGNASSFTASNNINVTSINIYDSSLLAGGANTIAGNLFVVGNSSATTGTFTGSNITSTSLTVGRDSFSNTFNNTGFLASQASSTLATINIIAGSFSNNGFAYTNVNSAFTVAATSQATLNANFQGTANTGTATNNGTLNLRSTFNLAGLTNNNIITMSGATNAANINNATGAQISVTGNSSNTATITNAGTATITTSASMTLTNSGTLQLNSGTLNNAGNIANNGTMNINGLSTWTGAGTVNNSNALNIQANITAASNITNSAGTTTISAGRTLINSATFALTGGTISIGSGSVLQNNSIMSLAASTSGAGIINNTATGALTISAGSNIATAITNAGTTTASGAGTTSNSFTNTGSLLLPVGSNLTVGSFVGNSGANDATFNIQGENSQGKLSSPAGINLTNTNIVVSAPANITSGSWTIVEAGAGLLTPSLTPPTLPPSSGFFTIWSYDYSANTFLNVSVINKTISSVASGPVNEAIAAALDGMQNSNPGQNILLGAVFSSTSEAQLDSYLQQLMPAMNASAPNIATQNTIFEKVQTRLASLNNGLTTLSTQMSGITAGDINPTTALWVSGFGSLAKQNQNGENFGYKSKSFGSVAGIDTLLSNGGIFGFGIGLSKTIVDELSNANSVSSVIGYHGLMYGSHCLPCEKFVEWLITGAYTTTQGSRQININNVIMSTGAVYQGGQGAFRLNYGINIDFDDYFTLAPVSTLQYVGLYQPSYTENYSPAALEINPSHYQQVLTAGAGMRLSFPYDEWWLLGTREIRVLGTYDIVSTTNNITSSFVVGSPDFTLVSSPSARFALKAGIDFSVAIMQQLYLTISYDYELRSKYYDNSGTIKLKFLF